MRRTSATGLRIAVVVAAALALTACSGGDDAPRSTRPGVPADLAPTSAPAGAQTLSGPTFELAVPSGWTGRTGKDARGVLVARAESASRPGVVVGVVPDEGSPGSAKDQSTILYELQRGPNRSTAVTREHVSWPGASDAWLVRWTTNPGAAAGATAGSTATAPTGTPSGTATTSRPTPVPTTFVQLMLEVRKGLIVNGIASGPAASFAASGALDVLRTLQVHSPASAPTPSASS